MPTQKPLQLVNLHQVRFSGDFWGKRQEIIKNVTINQTHLQLQQTGRIEALGLKWKPGDPNQPHRFWDSDVGKWVETVAYAQCLWPDEKPFLAELNEIVGLFAKAQQSEGYLNTHFTQVVPNERWTNLQDAHELYCAGHLMEAAVAHQACTGDQTFLETMVKYADYIAKVFGPRDEQIPGYPGHEEIELALVRLYRTTGDEKYLDLSKYFVDQRGQEPDFFEQQARQYGREVKRLTEWFDMATNKVNAVPGTPPYYQNHEPVREQEEAVGHAVRAQYLYAGMVDVAMETGDTQLLNACKRLWDDITYRKLYITGGVGPAAANEGFTEAYDLPNEHAYAETCAAIAYVFFSQRLLRVELEGKYADAMERALYNGVLSGISLDGKRFFYQNPLAVLDSEDFRERPEWYGCSCCPNNLTRLVLALGEYAYMVDNEAVYVNLYATSMVDLEFQGTKVHLRQDTRYPWDGAILFSLDLEKTTPFELNLRWPGWCEVGTLLVNGELMTVKPEKGYVHVKRSWNPGDTVELRFEMPVRRVYAHPNVVADQGRVALQRGPIVFCFEEVDNGDHLDAIHLPRTSNLEFEYDPNFLGGSGIVKTTGKRLNTSKIPTNSLYRSNYGDLEAVNLRAIPYHAWANRGKGEMLVWMKEI